ncbi:MAG: hypothetical protein JWN44_5963 [Myxococcales bacterium]|nr:hypothetical protein [Myxococcales bacterium]
MRIIVLACLAALAGCNDDFAGAALVDGLRLLAVQAEPPEATSGETVSLRAFAVDTHGGPVAISWSACLRPNDGAIDPACITGSSDNLALGDGETITMTVPQFSLETLGPPDGNGGVYLPIVVHLSSPDDAVDAVYRLRVAGGAPRNKNPRFAVIEPFRGTSPQPAYAGDHMNLVPRFLNDSFEQYEIPDPEAAPGIRKLVQETLTVQWFATAGTFGKETTSALQTEEYILDRNVPKRFGTVDLWAVGHDERGGVTIVHQTIMMQ